MEQLKNYEPSNLTVYLQQALRSFNKKYLYNNYVNSLPINPNSKVLEFGSGIGAMAELLAQKIHNGELTCVDISDRYISKARKNLRDYPNISFHHGRLAKLSVEDGTYDAINVHFVLHDVLKENRARLVREMLRLLKPGGKVYLREPIKESHGMKASEIQKLFTNAGFFTNYEQTKKLRFRGETYSACYSKLSNIQFFLS